ncbi:hypothetical protein ACFL2H_08065 [Planctomycetota bacterium]
MSRSNARVALVVLFAACCLSCFGDEVLPEQAPTAVVKEPVEETITKTHDLSRAISAHICTSKRSVRDAKSEAIAQLFLLPSEKEPIERVEVRPGVYEVTAPNSFHEHLVGMATWMADGEKQITIESRIVSISEEALQELQLRFASQWEMSARRAETQSFPATKDDLGMLSFGSFHQASLPTKESVSATTSVVRNLPCRIAAIDETELKAVLEEAQSDTRTNLMQAPKVTVFPGQQAVVKDTSQRPFVTSVKPVEGEHGTAMQPVITVLEEGLSLKIRVSVLGEDAMHVDTSVTIGEIGDVDEFTFETAEQANGTTVQIPEYLQRIVRVSKNLREGKSLLIDPHFFHETVLKRRFRRDITTRKYTIVILTPRIIQQPSEEDAVKVANL